MSTDGYYMTYTGGTTAGASDDLWIIDDSTTSPTHVSAAQIGLYDPTPSPCKFQPGDRVVKARKYDSERHCRYGGEDSKNPIGAHGVVTKVYHSQHVEVDFDGVGLGKEWSCHPSELDFEHSYKTKDKKMEKPKTDVEKKALKAAKEAEIERIMAEKQEKYEYHLKQYTELIKRIKTEQAQAEEIEKALCITPAEKKKILE